MSHCVTCGTSLVLEIVDSDDDEDVQVGGSSSAAGHKTVPDDVELTCGCHFHWDCLLEAYELTKCPNCGADITSTSREGAQQILANVNNEGGLQEGLDLMPVLAEESYLRAYPEERKARAFLEFCREGDIQAIVALLQDEDDEESSDVDVLRYQDPLGEMQSGLHAAVSGGSREVAWLLLLLASTLDLQLFPAQVFQEAAAMGIMRNEEVAGRADIRILKDAHGRTAEALAAEMGGVWHGWVGVGRLGLPQ